MAAVAAAGLAMAPPAIVQPAQEERQAPKRITRQRRASNLNRSKHWEYAETYKEARLLSPFPHRPVR